MIEFKKDSLMENMPSEDTYLTCGHLVSDPKRGGEMCMASEFVRRYSGVSYLYNEKFNNVYHIVVEDEEVMVDAQGLECESLKHCNPWAKKFI